MNITNGVVAEMKIKNIVGGNIDNNNFSKANSIILQWNIPHQPLSWIKLEHIKQSLLEWNFNR